MVETIFRSSLFYVATTGEAEMTKYATIDGFEDMSEQQIFDMVATHLRKQKRMCVNDHGRCVYSDGAGGMCAAGIFLKDEPTRLMCNEYGGWPGLTRDELVPETHSYLIYELQKCHDAPVILSYKDTKPLESGPRWLSEIQSRLVMVAKAFGLSASSVYA
jgi:hypothetical protein